MTPGGQFEYPAGSYHHHRVQKSQKPDAKVRFSWPNWPFCLIWQPQCTNWGVLGYWWAPWVPQWPKIDSTRPIFASYPPPKVNFRRRLRRPLRQFRPFGVTGACRLQRDVQYTHFWYTSTRKVPKIRFEAKKVYQHPRKKKPFRRFLGIFLLARWIGLPEPVIVSKDGLL